MVACLGHGADGTLGLLLVRRIGSCRGLAPISGPERFRNHRRKRPSGSLQRRRESPLENGAAAGPFVACRRGRPDFPHCLRRRETPGHGLGSPFRRSALAARGSPPPPRAVSAHARSGVPFSGYRRRKRVRVLRRLRRAFVRRAGQRALAASTGAVPEHQRARIFSDPGGRQAADRVRPRDRFVPDRARYRERRDRVEGRAARFHPRLRYGRDLQARRRRPSSGCAWLLSRGRLRSRHRRAPVVGHRLFLSAERRSGVRGRHDLHQRLGIWRQSWPAGRHRGIPGSHRGIRPQPGPGARARRGASGLSRRGGRLGPLRPRRRRSPGRA